MDDPESLTRSGRFGIAIYYHSFAWHQPTLQLFDESLILLQRVVLIVQELHAVAAQASRQQQRQDGAKANLGATSKKH